MKLFSFESFLTGYYPDDSALEGGKFDSHYDEVLGAVNPDYKEMHRLRTLQDFLDGDAQWVSVAGDADVMAYGTQLSIPEFNRRYATQIVFKFCDTGNAFQHKGFKRMDICTGNKKASEDDFLNGIHTVVALLD